MKKLSAVLLVLVVIALLVMACGLGSPGFTSEPVMTLTPSNPDTLFSPAPCSSTNAIGLPLNSDICAMNSAITITSSDGKQHSCIFRGAKELTVTIAQGKTSSDAFQLGAGEFTLTCDNLPRSVKVSVK